MISYRLTYTVIFALLLSSSLLNAQEDVGLQIEAQPLDSALREFAEQTGLQIMYSAEIGEGVQSPGAGEAESTTEALEHLLADTGLQYRFINSRTIAIQAVDVNPAEQRGDSDSKNSSPGPMQMAQNLPDQTRPSTTGRRSDDDATGVVSGQVTDARTGTNLKGALVKIDETEQATSTDTLGSFRFSGVAPGHHTLRISYLGYRDIVTTIDVRAGSAVDQDFVMTGGDGLEEIVVYGQRSARAKSLNQERTAEVSSTVISADLLGNFNGTTISEALRRAPGVAFVPDESTGDGAQVIIRGLEPDMNQVRLNGLRLPEASGLGRSADLSGLLAESIESVTINKTLLPSHDSNGAGGVVEIETKSPLDRPRRFMNFGVEYGEKGGDFGDNMLATGTVAGRFGADENLGASLSVQYRNRDVTNLSYALRGVNLNRLAYYPAGITNWWEIDPNLSFPIEDASTDIYPMSYDSSSQSIKDENISVTASLQKTFGDHSDLRFDLTQTVVETEIFSNATGAMGFTSAYEELPIDELNGELRYALVNEDKFAAFGRPGVIGAISRSATYRPDDRRETLTASLRGDTDLGRYEFNYGIGYTEGSDKSAASISVPVGVGEGSGPFAGLIFPNPDVNLSEDILNNTVNGRVISIFRPVIPNNDRFVYPGLTAQGLEFFNLTENVPIGQIQLLEGVGGYNERWSANFSARRNVENSWLRYIEVGLSHEEAEFGATRTGKLTSYAAESGVFASDIGFEIGPGILSQVGAENDLGGLTFASVQGMQDRLPSLVSDGVLRISRESDQTERNTVGTSEDDFAAYLQARADFGKLELIGGARLTRVAIDSTYFVSPTLTNADGTRPPLYGETYGQVVSASASQTDVLPRLLANYRWSDKVVIRGGYFSTASRPRVNDLTGVSGSANLDLRPQYGPQGDQPRLLIRKGNPDLRPAYTHNFDLSWEWYNDTVGVIKVSAFYKFTDDALQSTRTPGDIEGVKDGLVLPDAPGFDDLPDNLFVQIQQPVNGEDTPKLWGAELAFERQFTFLPGFWSGLGFYGNYTYADSEQEQTRFVRDEEIVITDLPFNGSPDFSGTASLTYNKYGFDANVSYTHQARRLSNFAFNGFSQYDEALETLDFRVEYLTDIRGAATRFYVSGRDLLSGSTDPYLQNSRGGEGSTPKYFTGSSYLGGRAFAVGFATSFD